MVRDLDVRAVAVRPHRHLDRAARGRERHRVLDQFGHHQRQVADDVRLDHDLRVGPQHHPLIALDLPQRGPYDVGERGRPRVQHGLADAGQQHQAVGVAAQAHGDVVDAVEPVEQRGIGLAALDRVDQRQLTCRQVADPAPHVAEHLGDVAPAEHLPLQQRRRRALHMVERLGELADLVAHGHRHLAQPRRPRVLRVVVGHPGQLAARHLGDPLRGPGQRRHRPHHGPPYGDREAEPEHEPEQCGGEQPAGPPPGVGGGVVGPAGDLVGQ